MLRGLMQDRPLLVSSLIDYGAELFGNEAIVSAMPEGPPHRTTYAEVRNRILRLAGALTAMGVRPGDIVATLAWNSHRHFELYYAISGIGAVCHTINPRLFPDQLAYIVEHAGDRALFFDPALLPLVEAMRPRWPSIASYVVLAGRDEAPASGSLPNLIPYEDLLRGSDPLERWPEFDETTACALCYTSGTTGEPKGALYSHRSTVLHALVTLAANAKSFGQGRPLMPIVPLFHVNAWGLPYLAPLSGTPLVFPGAKLDGRSVFDLLDSESVCSGWGVPTVWLGLLAEMRTRGRKPAALSEVLIGGSAVPGAMVTAFERDWGINVVHGWGMTEMSPVGTICRLPPDASSLPHETQVEMKLSQGRRLFGVETWIADPDGKPLPHDGVAQGELFVRGPTVISGYFRDAPASAAAIDRDGWLATGDVATIAPDGFLRVVDRTKDLVKSGGEWISSIAVENAALAHPDVANCAVIGVPHAKWSERPLLIVVPKAGTAPRKSDILARLAETLAKWQVPDDVVFVDTLPLTATGKVSKKDLRARFAGYALQQ